MSIDMTRFSRKTPEATVMEITPELAKEMLATSHGNRKLRSWYIDLLAASMKRGEWRITSQGIGFDWYGRLRDAHHRLTACIKADVSFYSVVVFGMPLDAYEVTDTGILRTYADRLNEDRRVTDVLRLGCQYACNTNKPTIDQMKPFIESGLGDTARALIEFCGTAKRYFSSAPMKLAACITIMNGGSSDFVLQQYRALCHMDFDAMSRSGQALVRQAENGRASVINPREALTRGFRVFDEERRGVSKIQISEADIDASVELVRSVLWRSVGVDNKPTQKDTHKSTRMNDLALATQN